MAGMTKDDIEERVVDIMATERNTRGGLLLSLWADIRDRGLAAEAEAEELRKEVEQLQTQLVGCSVAAKGYARGVNDCERGEYGWSASFEDVKELYAEKERLRENFKASEKAFEQAANANVAGLKAIDRLKTQLEIAAKENGRLKERVMVEDAYRIFDRIAAPLGVKLIYLSWNEKADRIIEAIEKAKQVSESMKARAGAWLSVVGALKETGRTLSGSSSETGEQVAVNHVKAMHAEIGRLKESDRQRFSFEAPDGTYYSFGQESHRQLLVTIANQKERRLDSLHDTLDQLVAKAKRADMAQAQAEHWAEKAGRFARNILDAKTILDRQLAQPAEA